MGKTCGDIKNTMIKGTVSLAGGLVLLVIIIILLTIALG